MNLSTGMIISLVLSKAVRYNFDHIKVVPYRNGLPTKDIGKTLNKFSRMFRELPTISRPMITVTQLHVLKVRTQRR